MTPLPVRHVVRCAFILCSLLFSCAAECAPGPRMALVIGNERYGDPTFNLPGARRDADLIAKTLQDPALGFTVTVANDLTTAQLRKAILDFSRALKKAGPSVIGFVYYAGHGGSDTEQMENYLIGSDVADVASADAAAVGYGLTEITERLATVDQPALIAVVIDACRTLSKPKTGVAAKDLRVAPMARLDEPLRGFLIALSTGSGSSASDSGRFADALAKNMLAPALSIDEVFDRTGKQINDATKGQQVPASAKNLASEVCLISCESDLRAGAYVQNKELFETTRRSALAALDMLLKVHADTRCPITWKELSELKLEAETLTARKQVDAAGATYAKIKEQQAETYPHIVYLENLAHGEEMKTAQQQHIHERRQQELLKYYQTRKERFEKDEERLATLEESFSVRKDRTQVRKYYTEAERLVTESRLEDAGDRMIDATNAIEKLEDEIQPMGHVPLKYRERRPEQILSSLDTARARAEATASLCR